MTEAEVEQVVLAAVRAYTLNEAAGPDSRFEADLHLNKVSRQMLFASLAAAFSARGVSLPSRGYFLSDFLTCPTPASVRDAIRVKVFRAPEPSKPAKPDAAPATTGASSTAAKGKPAKKASAKPAGAKKAPAKKAAAKKPGGSAKPRGGKRK
jgi:hypothetical protein